jgi:hypothetical protein
MLKPVWTLLPALAVVASALLSPVAWGEEQAEAKPPVQGETRANRPAEGAHGPGKAGARKPAPEHKTICDLIETAAAAHRLPVEFFTRLIWKESGFRPGATSHVGAQGIAQFMPGTAAERGLQDPYDVHQAIPASAHLLRDLRARFGNLGLAAAAYNAGPRRVEDWLAGRSGLPYETRDYVAYITGRDVEDWAAADRTDRALPDRHGSLDVKAIAFERRAAVEEKSCLAIARDLGRQRAAPTTLVEVARRRAPWGVQVAAHFSQSRALAKYSQIQRRNSRLLAGKEPMVVRELNRSRAKRPMYHVRVPAETRAEADRVCDSLRSAGAACVVLRTN